MPRDINNPLSSFYGAMRKVVGGLWSRWGGQGWSKIRTFLPSARFDWEREAGATWMNSIVALSIAWLGNRFPRPLITLCKLARNGDHIPLGRHDVIDLWKRPNKFYGRRTMEKAIGLSLIVDGNAYIYKVRDRLNRVIELWWVPHFRILPTWPMDGSEYQDGYFVWVDSTFYHLPVEDIIHIRDGIDPQNERLGLSALRACLREVVTLNYEASYTASILKNAGIPGIVIAPDDPQLRPSADDAERIKERFAQNFGIENDMAGSTAVLAGKYKVTALGFSPEAMRLDRLPLNAMGRISASTGVAAMSVGLPDPGKTYSNLAEANKSSWGTIQAIQELIGNTLDDQLLPDFGLDPNSYNISYNYELIQELQEPLDAIHARAREDFQSGLIQRNEGREMIGLEPDESEDGDAYFPGTTGTGAPDAMGGDMFGSNGSLTEAVAKRLQLPFLMAANGTKYNPNHDSETGEFAEDGGGGGGFVFKPPSWAKPKPSAPTGVKPPETAPAKPAAKPIAKPSAATPAKPATSTTIAPSHHESTAVQTKPTRDLGNAPAKEVAAHHNTMSEQWRGSLSEAEHFEVRRYTGQVYAAINEELRNPKSGQAQKPDSIVSTIDAALRKSSLKEDTTVYRGVSDLSKLGIDVNSAVGTVIKDKAYMSTSLSNKAAKNYAGDSGAILKITAKAGSKGASVGGITRYPKEAEVLFARGSGVKITGITKQKDGTHLIEAELVQ